MSNNIKKNYLQYRKKINNWLIRHKPLYILVNILLLPFKIIYKFFNFILNFSNLILNLLLIILILGSIVGIYVGAKVLPMYQDASEQAYEKLSTLNKDDFHMLSNTKVYDCTGRKIGEIDSGSYHYVKINNISKYVQYGYIATEDKRFTEHCGVDLQSITRAGLALVKHNGEITQGGSTITQQVIKNNLLSQEQSYSRKLTEVLLAPSLEKKFSKSDIMEFYCNSNYYGNQCYGIETASKFYFGKKAKDLTLAEAAMLCGVSNSPNNYNPVASIKLATEKKEEVLNNMLNEKYITQKEFDKAMEQKITVVGLDKTHTSENYMVSYALYCATIQLMKDDGFNFKYLFKDQKEQEEYKAKYSEVYGQKSAEIRAGGYKIYTSFDQNIQKKLQKSISNTLASFTEKDKKTKKYALQSAAMCIDNETQYIVAVVGGRTAKDQYNRAFLSARQPGSTIKPLLDYGPAIDNGVINASSIINDSKVYWSGTNSYSPLNSGGGYRGPVTVREGLARSLNTVAFQIFKKTGIDTSLKYLEKMHFTQLSYADSSAPAISLGGFTNGLTISDMCKGYAALENDGQYSSRTCITEIKHETKGDIYKAPELEDSNTEVFSADTSFVMKDVMQGTFNEAYGTAHSAYNNKQIYAGKTGTTSSNKDAWFCGFSAYYTTSVWIGYDIPRTMSGMYGGTYPLKIWSKFMNNIHNKLPMKNFDMPTTIELKKVSGGNLIGDSVKIETNRDVNTKGMKAFKYNYGKRFYKQRPSGYEYYSQQNAAREKAWKLAYELRLAKKAAETAVSKFEKYKIQSVENALHFDKEYEAVLAVIDKIPDEYQQTKYKTRATDKYNSLNDTAMTDWKLAIKEYQKDKVEKVKKQEKIDAEDAKTKAKETLKANRIQKAEWYIQEIKNRSYYTDIAKLLVEDGLEAVKRCKGYSDYKRINEEYQEAVLYIQQKPEKPEEPTIKKDETDDTTIDQSKYQEETLDVNNEE